ncbi:hypothetical protein POM88_024756 [Heracleum sosnowskyi]|uniref:Uncharacterized protein n=1 Tax=Heracleum sosnowskyi TaxID=360622 RepID=A0AAD8I4T0_9APIA|nr:hypothetical protein POM88_024756 [Heracleum sosnowskyi]
MEKVNAYPENLEDGEKEKVKTREKVKEKTREKENKQEKGNRRDKGPTLHPELQCELRVELLKEDLVQSRYGAILEARGVNLSELTPASEVDEPLELWLAATTGSTERPQRNRIVGFPTIPASQLLSNLAHRFRERAKGGASSSSSSANRPIILDQVFLQIIRTAVTNAQANPDQFGNLNNSEMEEVARNIIEVSDPSSRGSFNQVFFREVVNVVATNFKSICDETQEAIDQANRDYSTDDDGSDENGSDDAGEDDDGSDDAGDDGDVGGDNARNDYAIDEYMQL